MFLELSSKIVRISFQRIIRNLRKIINYNVRKRDLIGGAQSYLIKSPGFKIKTWRNNLRKIWSRIIKWSCLIKNRINFHRIIRNSRTIINYYVRKRDLIEGAQSNLIKP